MTIYIKRYKTYEKDREEWTSKQWLNSTIYLAFVNTIELQMVFFFCIIYKKYNNIFEFHNSHPNFSWISQRYH